MAKLLVGGGLPHPPQQGKPCINFANRFLNTMKKLFAHHIYTSCAKAAILLLQDLNTLCVTDIYIWCILRVQCNTINLLHHEHV